MEICFSSARNISLKLFSSGNLRATMKIHYQNCLMIVRNVACVSKCLSNIDVLKQRRKKVKVSQVNLQKKFSWTSFYLVI